MKKIIILLSTVSILGICSCKTSSSVSEGSRLEQEFSESFLTLAVDQIWSNYKAMFKQGSRWTKIVSLNDSSMSLKYDMTSYDPKLDSYTIKVSSSKETNDYKQNKDAFISDLSTVYSFSKRQDCSKKLTTLNVSGKEYSTIELFASGLSVDDVVAVFPDVEGLRNMVTEASVNMWVLPKEAVVLKTSIILQAKDKKKISFSMDYVDLVL